MRILTLAAALGLTASAAQAQFATTPNIYGHPEYGYTTVGPNGQQFVTTPDIYGHPEYGSTTVGPNGQRFETTPDIYGFPEYGTTTRRR